MLRSSSALPPKRAGSRPASESNEQMAPRIWGFLLLQRFLSFQQAEQAEPCVKPVFCMQGLQDAGDFP